MQFRRQVGHIANSARYPTTFGGARHTPSPAALRHLRAKMGDQRDCWSEKPLTLCICVSVDGGRFHLGQKALSPSVDWHFSPIRHCSFAPAENPGYRQLLHGERQSLNGRWWIRSRIWLGWSACYSKHSKSLMPSTAMTFRRMLTLRCTGCAELRCLPEIG